MAQLAAVQSGNDEPSMENLLVEAVAEAEVEEETGSAGSIISQEERAKKVKKAKKAKVDHLAKHGLPIQQITGDLADSWERWSNALSPTSPPLHHNAARIKVALHILPAIISFLVFPSWFILKAISFAAGFAFFGDPAFKLLVRLLDEKAAGWQEAIEIRQCVGCAPPTSPASTDISSSSTPDYAQLNAQARSV
jgi:hypothetical protein